MQKYILILTKMQYVCAFREFIAHKKRLGFKTEFAIVDEPRDPKFSNHQALRLFISKKFIEFGGKHFFLLIAGTEKYYKKDLNAKYGDFQYAFSNNLRDLWVYCAVGRILGEEDEIQFMCKKVIEYETNIPDISTFSIAATNKHKKFWESTFNQFEYISKHQITIEKVASKIKSKQYTFINFMGHGNKNFCKLASGVHFHESDICLIDKPLHFLAWACSAGRNMGKNCILRHKVITFWGAKSVTYGDINRMMIEIFMNKLLRETGDMYIGEAYMEAVNEIVKSCRETDIKHVLGYSMYGDPSLKIR